MSEWRPIESAPLGDLLVTDGKHFSVCYKHRYPGCVWYVWRPSSPHSRALQWDPMYWMPLPDFPK